ncbi:MAG: hypothetical protein KIT84_12370 [Labilithrix sp.]|nr:hypothetical protein [Labilithrix sp.]MCW5811808.1 hypothetical protein [Labilithrix sp.]
MKIAGSQIGIVSVDGGAFKRVRTATEAASSLKVLKLKTLPSPAGKGPIDRKLLKLSGDAREYAELAKDAWAIEGQAPDKELSLGFPDGTAITGVQVGTGDNGSVRWVRLFGKKIDPKTGSLTGPELQQEQVPTGVRATWQPRVDCSTGRFAVGFLVTDGAAGAITDLGLRCVKLGR